MVSQRDFGRIFQIETLILIKTKYVLFTYIYCSCDSIDSSSCLVLISQHMVANCQLFV